MSDLIEREKLIQHFQKCIGALKNISAYTGDFEACLKAVQNQPAAEVEPVKHGHWIHIKSPWNGGYIQECSHCKETIKSLIGDLPYCPHCGTKMDLGRRVRIRSRKV